MNTDLVETLNAKHYPSASLRTRILNNIQTEMLERAKRSDTD